MWAIRRKRNAIRPGEIRKDIMEEETSDMGLKAEAESRLPGHCIKQAEETREKFQQNTNKE